MTRLKEEEVIEAFEAYFDKVKIRLDAVSTPVKAITGAANDTLRFTVDDVVLAITGSKDLDYFRGAADDAAILAYKNNAGDRSMIIDLRNRDVHVWDGSLWWNMGDAAVGSNLVSNKFYLDKINRHIWFRSKLSKFVKVVDVTAP